MISTYATSSAAVLALALSAAVPVWAADAPRPSITVTGEASVAAEPDMAILTLGVVKTAKTARAALDENSKALASVIANFKTAGVAAKDLQTSGFSINPQFDYSNNGAKPPELTGYQVNNTLTIRVRDLANLGTLLDQAITDGANSAGGITFTNSNIDELMNKARQAAVKDAIARAKTLTEAAGVKTGAIESISESRDMPPSMPMVRMAMAKEADSVPVEAGENRYQAQVTVTFSIDQ
jgi:uncharacterized protein